jgi:hypothetical protein
MDLAKDCTAALKEINGGVGAGGREAAANLTPKAHIRGVQQP